MFSLFTHAHTHTHTHTHHTHTPHHTHTHIPPSTHMHMPLPLHQFPLPHIPTLTPFTTSHKTPNTWGVQAPGGEGEEDQQDNEPFWTVIIIMLLDQICWTLHS